MTSLQEQTDLLLEEQKKAWPLLGSNWDLLNEVQVRKFRFDETTITVQFNPKRIRSSAARVDQASILKRSCFLCARNRPPEQKSVLFGKAWEILCNPFPIFREHYTIPTKSHTPQVILPEFSDYLDLSRELHRLVVFYNAPACGASAPDHMHFQAGNRGLMPIEGEIESLKRRYGRELLTGGTLRISAIADGLRRFFVLETSSKPALEHAFSLIFELMASYQGEEPMLNLLCYYQGGEWQLFLFPREKHRPWQYFKEGEGNILLSPAAVDMGGTLITPLEKDFHSISGEDISDIFGQVTCSEQHFHEISGMILSKLSTYEE
jgi:hypothetical protein